ncbi:DNA polymerase III subunit gamma/tau [Neochlamydia sp. AcF65]|uniref:DNA polymerase III subunit gamma/tau n=1 Tax=Neochlamydia sp. AcF65 TaxID=2795735 RepID=UPI001BC9055E|nr:DNA polymerase III subunit gamma/tau [Neochlamydia sp. AcF65]
MTSYQVLARKYRPQTFAEVLNQDAIVTTLKNAIKNNRLAQAYLFCGSRGTGKTTLARILAKALNCHHLTEQFEPCNRCKSCQEITSGHSLDVLEIDGASNRGIDDIRQINETVGYAASAGGYKIYIIDEVHMLTKEAFNALLKTLEEPPPKVKFLFATTEAHKVLPTILSRCQRFNLKRISPLLIQAKLRKIAEEQNIQVEDEALRLIANHAEGGLRDAESLFDQVLSFHDGLITASTVACMLGIVESDYFFKLDKASQESNLAVAFDISEEVFSQGKDIVYFVEKLTEHFRNILVVKLSGTQAPFLHLSEEEREKYAVSAKVYSQEACLMILDFLVEAHQQIRFAPSPKTTLEALFLRIIRAQSRIPVDILVRRLVDLEQKISKEGSSLENPSKVTAVPPGATPAISSAPPSSPIKPEAPSPAPKLEPLADRVAKEIPSLSKTSDKLASTTVDPNPYATPAISSAPLGSPIRPEAPPPPAPKLEPLAERTAKEIPSLSKTSDKLASTSVDPTPSPADLGIVEIVEKKGLLANSKVIKEKLDPSKISRYDTIMQFAAVELEGTIQKKLS